MAVGFCSIVKCSVANFVVVRSKRSRSIHIFLASLKGEKDTVSLLCEMPEQVYERLALDPEEIFVKRRKTVTRREQKREDIQVRVLFDEMIHEIDDDEECRPCAQSQSSVCCLSTLPRRLS